MMTKIIPLLKDHAVLAAQQAIWKVPSGKFYCPICIGHQLHGPTFGWVGSRPLAKCLKCGSYERHRLQIAVLKKLLGDSNDIGRILHVAPEPSLSGFLRERSSIYTSCDLNRPDVDLNFSLTEIPFADSSFDLVYASHVLEHIKESDDAVREIYRVLKSGGLAILPVPIVTTKTFEYSKPCRYEHGHVRACGLDFNENVGDVFDGYQLYSSVNFPEVQTKIHENRRGLTWRFFTERPAMQGLVHNDYVPVFAKK